MADDTVIDLSDLTLFIRRDGGQLVTDSRAVALAFEKEHKRVLRRIQAMLASVHPEIAAHAEANFGLSSYVDSTGRRLPMYRLSAKGFSELGMSFTGEKACVTRIRFLNAFEAVAERLAQAERTIAERLHDWEGRNLPSKEKGRIGAGLMNERKREKPALDAEAIALEALSQPNLFGPH